MTKIPLTDICAEYYCLNNGMTIENYVQEPVEGLGAEGIVENCPDNTEAITDLHYGRTTRQGNILRGNALVRTTEFQRQLKDCSRELKKSERDCSFESTVFGGMLGYLVGDGIDNTLNGTNLSSIAEWVRNNFFIQGAGILCGAKFFSHIAKVGTSLIEMTYQRKK